MAVLKLQQALDSNKSTGKLRNIGVDAIGDEVEASLPVLEREIYNKAEEEIQSYGRYKIMEFAKIVLDHDADNTTSGIRSLIRERAEGQDLRLFCPIQSDQIMIPC